MRDHVRPFSLKRVALSDSGTLPSYVRIGKSKLPGAGRGLFATRWLPEGTYVTAYPGPLVDYKSISNRTRAATKYHRKVQLYELEIVNGTTALMFRPDPDDLTKGIAHMANDAIHPEVTGFSNNCDFIQDENCNVYLCTTRNVRRGEELLVDYLLPYWTSYKRPPKLISKWLEGVRKIQKTLNTMDVELEQYMGNDEFQIHDPHLRVLCNGCDSQKKRRIRNCCKDNTIVSSFKCATCNSKLMYM